MLTGRLPFNFSTERELLKAQKEGLNLLPTNLRLDVSPLADEVLAKALALNPAERFSKARDFGDAFFHALTTGAPAVREHEIEEKKREVLTGAKQFSIPKPVEQTAAFDAQNFAAETEIPAALETASDEPKAAGKIETAKTNDNPPWEKRSPEPIKSINGWRIGATVLFILILCAVVWGIWNYFLNHPNPTVAVAPKTKIANQNVGEKLPENNEPENPARAREVESPPLPRQINPPPDAVFFQNSKENLSGDLAKNFRGFSFYYPQDWMKNPSRTNFVDVARVGATGTPIEQMIVTSYDSKGTMAADAENFPRLAQKSNTDLAAIISDYHVVSQGETIIANGWKAYQVKFEGSGVTKNGDKITLWGRRLWIPAARLGVKTGFLITLLATSNSPVVKSADDVGVKGELANVLNTFEPAPLDTGY